VLNKIFGSPQQGYSGAQTPKSISNCCVGKELMPRWRGPDQMDDDTNALGFVCHACGREFGHDMVRNRKISQS